MIIAIDIGNTNIVAGVYNGDKMIFSFRLATNSSLSSDEYGLHIYSLLKIKNIDKAAISGSIICSVVPPLTHVIETTLKDYFNIEPIIVAPGIKTGINIKYETPKALGSDRLVNAVAAYHLYKGPAIALDLGTATKFDVVNEHGDYLGGAIAPGLKISSEALFNKASKLSKVSIEIPKKIIGKNTEDSTKAGIVYGYIGLITNVIKDIENELGVKIKTVATGGLCSLICPHVENIDYINQDLTITGLKILYELNK